MSTFSGRDYCLLKCDIYWRVDNVVHAMCSPWEGGVRVAAFVSGGALPIAVRGTKQTVRTLKTNENKCINKH